MIGATGPTQHRTGALAADRIIHITGTLAGLVGSALLVGIAALTADRPVFYASVVYSFAFSRCSPVRQPTISPPPHPDERLCAELIMPRSF